jgi:hypothetical protein
MIRDCRAGKPEGWRYFVREYVPVIRKLMAHYFPDRAGDQGVIERVLAGLHGADSGLFRSLDPAPERAFVSELRQKVLAAVEADRASTAPEIAVDLETLTGALEPLTLTEKLAVWFETMRYPAEDAGRMLRMSTETAQGIRGRGGELIRARVDAWRASLLTDNGPWLGRAAATLATKDCTPAKAFFDVIDGRATWRGREEMERHVKGCWFCVDHYGRLLEVVDMLRGSRALSDAEAEPYDRLLGIQARKRGLWRRATT